MVETKGGKKKSMTKKELIITGLTTVICTIGWLVLTENTYRDFGIVMLAGLAGITGTIFFLNLWKSLAK